MNVLCSGLNATTNERLPKLVSRWRVKVIPELLKLRGKAISYHSQFINEFCADYGVPKRINQGLIKKAKVVGSDLGFLS